MSVQRSRASATTAPDADRCVAGEFIRDYHRDRRVYTTSYVVVRFTARGLGFEGHWLVFTDPVFNETWHWDGHPASSRDPVRTIAGTHRIPLSRVREITYDHADCVP